MADIKNIKVGNTTYSLRDSTALQNLTAAQETTLLSDGTYKGEDVANGTVFTTEDGKFKEFGKEQDGLQDVSQLFDYKCVYASSDKFFYITSNSSTYGYSTNGIDWNTGTLPTWITGGEERVFFVNGNTLKIANCSYGNYNGYTFTSTDDGATWSYTQMNMQGKPDVSKGWYLSGGLYVMCSDIRTNTTLYYSTDAVDWTDGVSGMPESNYGSCFCSDGTYLYLLGTSGKFYKTTDCVNWTEIGTSTEVATVTTSLEFYQGKFWIYKSTDGNGFDNIFSSLKYSTDGLNWTSVPAITTSITDGQTKSAFRLNYCGDSTAGQFVLCLRFLSTGTQNYDSSDYYYVSSNGVDWEEQTFDETYVAQSSSYKTNPTNFASTGSAFVIASSTNKSYKGLASPTYTYSLTPLSYDKDEVDALISGGGSVALDDIAQAGDNITFTTGTVTDNIAASDKIGSPTITREGLFTPTDTAYLQITSASVGSSVGTIFSSGYAWELIVKFRTPASYTNSSWLWVYGGSIPLPNAGGVLTDQGKIGFNFKVSNWESYTGTTTLDTDTDYYAKFIYDTNAGKFFVKISKDGTNWTPEIESTSGGALYGGTSQYLYISNVSSSTPAVQFDLNGLSLTSSYNSTDWKAYTYIPSKTIIASSTPKETYTNPALTASGDICTWTVSHTLGTRDVIATVYDTTTYKEILAEIVHTDASTLTINITSSSNISAGAYKVVIIG